MTDISFHEQVRIVPYREEWMQRFRIAKELIIALLLTANIECDVRHVGFHMANLHERGLLHMERRGGHPSLYRLMVTPESHPECFTQSNDEPKRLSDAETSGMTRSEYAATS